MEPQDVRVLREEVGRLGRQCAEAREELDACEGRARLLEGQRESMRERWRGEQARSSAYKEEQVEAQRRLEQQLRRSGEDQGWRVVCEQEPPPGPASVGAPVVTAAPVAPAVPWRPVGNGVHVGAVIANLSLDSGEHTPLLGMSASPTFCQHLSPSPSPLGRHRQHGGCPEFGAAAT